jgi:hypothetical protein
LREYVTATESSLTERLVARSTVASLCYSGLYRRLGAFPSFHAVGQPGAVYGEPNPLAPELLERDLSQAARPAVSREIRDRLAQAGWIEKGWRWEISPWLLRSIILHPEGPADSLVTRAETAAAMQQEWRLCEGLLREMHHVAAAGGAEFVILAIPHSHAVSGRWVHFLGSLGCEVNDRLTTTRTLNNWLANFAQREQIACLDVLEQFRAAEIRGERLYFDTDDHLTPQGQRLLGRRLADALRPRLAAAESAAADYSKKMKL